MSLELATTERRRWLPVGVLAMAGGAALLAAVCYLEPDPEANPHAGLTPSPLEMPTPFRTPTPGPEREGEPGLEV